MKKIAVIGSGPAGCILDYGSVNGGFDLTLYSDRTPEQWLRESKLTGSVYLYDKVIDIERALSMDHWSNTSFRGQGFLLDILPSIGGKHTAVKGRTEFGRQGAAIDQRMRTSRWLSDFEGIGGRLVIEIDTPERLDKIKIALQNDLTCLAADRPASPRSFPVTPSAPCSTRRHATAPCRSFAAREVSTSENGSRRICPMCRRSSTNTATRASISGCLMSTRMPVRHSLCCWRHGQARPSIGFASADPVKR